jgi:hypothetical protein
MVTRPFLKVGVIPTSSIAGKGKHHFRVFTLSQPSTTRTEPFWCGVFARRLEALRLVTIYGHVTGCGHVRDRVHVFFMDVSKLADIVDFWNQRADDGRPQ